MNEFAIDIQNLTRRFSAVTAVDGITLQVPRGTLFGFLGPNGAGKTTTIRLLLGLLEPDDGSARVLGLDTKTQSEAVRARCGALLEYSGLYDRLTAEDNLGFYADIWHLPKAEKQARLREVLTDLGLWERRKDLVRDWSRGMRQKLAVGRALLHHPEVLFLDEPTAGLDPVAAAALREDLSRLAQQHGVTVFLTTHNLVEAEKLCQLVGVIVKGRLQAIGSPAELRRSASHTAEISGAGFSEALASLLRQQPQVLEARLENGVLRLELNPEAEMAPLVGLIVANGGQVEEVRRGKASLEEVFMTLVTEEGEEAKA